MILNQIEMRKSRAVSTERREPLVRDGREAFFADVPANVLRRGLSCRISAQRLLYSLINAPETLQVNGFLRIDQRNKPNHFVRVGVHAALESAGHK